MSGERPASDGSGSYPVVERITWGRPGNLRPGRRKVLVAGAHRRVAGALINRLLDDPRVELILATSDRECPPTMLGHDPARFAWVTTDLGKRRSVDNLFMLDMLAGRPLDTVVHLAFQGNPHRYDAHRHEFNVTSARLLLDAALRNDVSKYVFLSSDAVYKLGPRTDYKVKEDADLNLDPDAHPLLRDTVDAEFQARAKMDHPRCEVVVMRPSGVLGGGVISGLNMLFESTPPLLPIGFDPMINPTTKARLARDLHVAAMLFGKGLYNVAGTTIGPLSRFMAQRGITPRRVPGITLAAANRVQRALGQTRFHYELSPLRLFYSLVLDDAKFEKVFRRHCALVDDAMASAAERARRDED